MSLPLVPEPSTGVVAPIVEACVITILSQASEINAPAEIARLLTKAIVSAFASKIASRITVAASTLPPNVSISKTIASTSSASASSITRSIKADTPGSIMPSSLILTW